MMASIPNTRSAPLPLPTAKSPPAGEPAPGDFAAKLPAAPGKAGQPGQPAPYVPQVAQAPAEGDASDGGETVSGEEGDHPLATKADAPASDRDVSLIAVVPFIPAPQPAPVRTDAPGLDAPLTVGADETVPTQAYQNGAEPILATPGGRRSCGTDADGKPGPALPPAPEASEETVIPRELEAAVKDLVLRKQVLARQAGATDVPADAAKADAQAGPAQAAPTAPGATASAPASASAPAALPSTVDQLQPALAPNAQPVPLRADAAGTGAPARSPELAGEGQLDLANSAEWLDRLARDIALAGSRDAPLRFRLHPQTLGHLHVELQQGDHGTAVRLTVETEAARQLLTDAQPRLAAEARAQGVRIAETHVDLSGSGRHAPGDQRRQDEARQTPFIRTARGAGPDTVLSAREPARARLDRYA
ncbi:MAG TPA: flagellar hook-length control protein FliK [Allosphingosinicella sp.]|nr:flagellar hook-length control protein FliK [Allosphingosinicella sp.]